MSRRFRTRPPAQGFALIALLALITAGILYFLVGQLDAATIQRKRDESTALALAQAKEALIGFAASVDLAGGGGRPGDLPCPDKWPSGHINAGRSTTPCSTSTSRLGRLPWRTLGIADLRDGSAEGLWYAVSTNFKNSPRIGVLNSDTTGTISVRDGAGNLLFDGSSGGGVVAVIIAPGPPVRRLDGLVQDRTTANFNNAVHYLDDIAVEDNADFDDGTTNGFHLGPVRDPANPDVTVSNDRIAVITRAEIMAAIEKRVAAEVMNCLAGYAANPANNNRYPWPADIAASGGGTYSDTAGTLFGRIPDLMCSTGGDGVTLPCNTPPAGTIPGMLTAWGGVANCNIGSSWFLNNWREQVFFAVADAYKPAPGVPSCGACVTVNNAGMPAATNRQVVVLVAGQTLAGQARTTPAQKGNVANYLELENSSPLDGVFETRAASSTFNDRVRYVPFP